MASEAIVISTMATTLGVHAVEARTSHWWAFTGRSHALRGEDTDDLPAEAHRHELPIGVACEVDQFTARQ